MTFLKSSPTPWSPPQAPDDTGHRKVCGSVKQPFTYLGGMRTSKNLPESETCVWKVPMGRSG